MDVGGLVFFVDRSLGRKGVPQGLRSAGWQLVTLAEHYGIPHDEDVLDEDWLELAGAQGWIVLMKDDRIRYRRSERMALRRAAVHAFCLSGGNLTAADMVTLFLRHESWIAEACRSAGPSLHILSRSDMRSIDLDE